jgi:Zn-dependent protease with chaperone function
MTLPATPPTTGGYHPPPALAGPADRISFFAEQARNRRASWVFGALSAVAVIITGIPLGVLTAPLLYLLAMPLGLAMTALLPHSSWALLLVLPATLFPILAGASHNAAHVTFTSPQGDFALHGMAVVALATGLAIVPGALVFVLIWLVVRIVLRRAGPRAILATLGARHADLDDAEERLFVDVVEEVAVAAGIPAPRVAVIDAKTAGDAANAATVGWSVNDVTVVVTRPLLDELTREQVQAMIARVVASIGNGDLTIALRMLSIFQTVRIIQFALFGVSRWPTLRVFWRCARLALRRRPPATDAQRSDELSVATDLLAVGSFRVSLSQAVGHYSLGGCLLAPILFPFRFTAWTIGFIISTSEYVLTGPLVDAALRRRELLSDATAVRLTRNPDGLAGALERARAVGTVVPRADNLSSLFAVWWPVTLADKNAPVVLFARKPHATAQRRLGQLIAMGAHPVTTDRPSATPNDAFVSTPARPFDSSVLIPAFVGIALFHVVWAMSWMAMWLTSFELFGLGFVGLWIARRLAIGPH